MNSNKLSQPPIFGYPRYDHPFRRYTDASSFALGAILGPVQDGIVRVKSYAEKSLSASKKNNIISKKEFLALVYAVKHSDYYLRHNKFGTFVDHCWLQ